MTITAKGYPYFTNDDNLDDGHNNDPIDMVGRILLEDKDIPN